MTGDTLFVFPQTHLAKTGDIPYYGRMSSRETEQRVFPLEMIDRDRNKIQVQWSSLATTDAVRIYTDAADGSSTCIHLDNAQAVIFRDALNEWLSQAGADH